MADVVGLTGFCWLFAALNLAGAALTPARFGPRDARPPVRTGSPAAA